MPAKNPRINALLEPPVYRAVERMARREGVSLSQMLRDLVVRALELTEDAGLEELAERRRRTFSRAKAITAAEIRRRLG
jgi:hypothetical protein